MHKESSDAGDCLLRSGKEARLPPGELLRWMDEGAQFSRDMQSEDSGHDARDDC